MAKRTRHVFPTEEVPHLWMHQSQESATNPKGRHASHGNLYFEKETIYSYGSHFPIAMHVTEGKKKAILFTTNSYSNTTAKQRAIPRDYPVFYIPSQMWWSRPDCVKAYQKTVDQKFEEAKKARKWAPSAFSAMMAEFNEARAFEKFFKRKSMVKLPVTGKKLKEFEAECKAKERRAIELEQTALLRKPELDAKREKRDQAEQFKVETAIQQAKENYPLLIDEWKTQLVQWQIGTSNSIPRFPRFEIKFSHKIARKHGYNLYQIEREFQQQFPQQELEVMLRVEKDEVVTSMGARVPVEHAKRGLRLVKAVMKSGKEYHRNGHTEHLGHYAIDSITKDGTLKAGCHVIRWSAIEKIAPSLEAKNG